jgi:Uma2 family endonuclease
MTMSTHLTATEASPRLALKRFASRAPHPITLGEYLSMPEGAPYYQFINGKPVSMPSPTFEHQIILFNLAMLLRVFVTAHKLGTVNIAPLDVYLSDTEYYQPDIIFVAAARRGIIDKKVYGAPDLVVEILSPSNAEDDLTHKRAVYEAFGVREYWIVNPAERTVTVLANVDGAFQQVSVAQSNDNDDSVESALLAGFRVSLADVFQS